MNIMNNIEKKMLTSLLTACYPTCMMIFPRVTYLLLKLFLHFPGAVAS